ncbi:MAG: ABC transporter permease [Deltaproteobacteria bacterium]|nr:ABC transporter permease [Candidatus Tharpella sp.]
MPRIYDHVYPVFKLTANNIRRHPVINLISIMIISIAMLMLALYFLAYINTDRVVSTWRSDLKVAVYLEDDLSPESIALLKSFCLDLDEVVQLDYISKDEALSRFQVILGKDSGFLDDLPENPLPASLELLLDAEVADISTVERLARQLQRQSGVDEVVYGSYWLRQLFSLLRMVKYFGFIFASFLSVVTVFVVASTIRLSLFARRETIRVLYLVGATRRFVVMPYLFEGIFQGAVASSIALALSYVGFRYFKFWLQEQVPEWSIAPMLQFFSLSSFLTFLLLGILLGVAGFLISSRWLSRD